MLKLYQDLSAESEPLGLPQKPLPLLLMDVNVLLPYKSAPFSGFYTFLPTAINHQTENIINPLSILRKNISNMLILLPISPSQT